MGNYVSRPLAGGVCEISMIATHPGVQCSHEVHVQRGLWQKWKDFNDHFYYYIYRVNFHYVICILREDTKAALAIDLVVDKDASKWYVRVRETEWRPGNWSVTKSKHKWHAAAALNALQPFVVDFDKWSAFANNCSSFAKGLVGFMSDDDRRAKCECEPITDDFDRLSTHASNIQVELTYMSNAEVAQSIPKQEDGVEEPVDCDQNHRDLTQGDSAQEDSGPRDSGQQKLDQGGHDQEDSERGDNEQHLEKRNIQNIPEEETTNTAAPLPETTDGINKHGYESHDVEAAKGKKKLSEEQMTTIEKLNNVDTH